MGTESLGCMKADYLKRKADGEVKKQNYRDAIEHYTEALKVSVKEVKMLLMRAWMLTLLLTLVPL